MCIFAHGVDQNCQFHYAIYGLMSLKKKLKTSMDLMINGFQMSIGMVDGGKVAFRIWTVRMDGTARGHKGLRKTCS